MKTEHTPGPCMVAPTAGFAVGVFKGQRAIALLADGWGADKRDANARLIAAAPVLRDCVLAFVNQFSNAAESDGPIEGADAVDWISQHSAEFRAALKASR